MALISKHGMIDNVTRKRIITQMMLFLFHNFLISRADPVTHPTTLITTTIHTEIKIMF